jgi:hypothetical protein
MFRLLAYVYAGVLLVAVAGFIAVRIVEVLVPAFGQRHAQWEQKAAAGAGARPSSTTVPVTAPVARRDGPQTVVDRRESVAARLETPGGRPLTPTRVEAVQDSRRGRARVTVDAEAF